MPSYIIKANICRLLHGEMAKIGQSRHWERHVHTAVKDYLQKPCRPSPARRCMTKRLHQRRCCDSVPRYMEATIWGTRREEERARRWIANVEVHKRLG